ncbi:hypothetical protein [Luteolibacter sp. Populi]|uniref:hypothetical protein n=1 Tax=Luteolibacter sp. Populi TaxID=3230487 RepID=UPI0034660AB1
MSDPHHRRWQLSFVVMRWRQLFWLLPLAALLIGTAVEWRKYLKRDQATGVFQNNARNGWPSLEKIRDIILSDEVLGAASIDAFLLGDWGTKEECIGRLRPMIEVEPIPRTTLVEITVKGRKTFRTVAICDALMDRSAKHARELQDRMFFDAVKPREAKVDELGAAIHAKQVEIARSSASVEWQLQATRELTEMEAERQNILNSLMTVTGCVLTEEPLIIHERPIPVRAHSWRDFVGPATWIAAAVCIAMMAAVSSAYLLELFFPRAHKQRLLAAFPPI